VICVSVGEPTVARCLDALRGARLAEARLDLIRDADRDLERLFRSRDRRIATCRPGRLGDKAREALLVRAVEAGAAFVDIELEAPLALRRAVTKAARARGCQLIVSFHDWERVPSRAELARIERRCFAAGADIAKIAGLVRKPADAARLLGLLGEGRPVVVVGLGPCGRLVRVAAPLLGSPFTYAAPERGRRTGPGQLTASETERAIAALRKLGGRAR
jgi:3-dehydroquinate dehydratase type I